MATFAAKPTGVRGKAVSTSPTRVTPLSVDEKRDLLAELIRKKLRSQPSVDDLIDRHRQQFPALNGKSYFNYGAHGTLPRPAIDAVLESWEYMQKWGPFSTEINDWIQQEINKTIACFAKLLGASPETIALTENVTTGCNIVLWGLEWKEGDHILISDCENPGIVAAIREVARRFRLTISTFSIETSEAETIEAFASGLRSNTRLAVISHVLWNTGQVLPLKKIAECCRANPVSKGRTLLLVDGAQSAGVLPMNLSDSGTDFLAFTAHKWLCGPEGVGGLFVSPESLDFVQPAFVGWRSVKIDETNGAMSWQPGARRFHVSTSAYSLFAGLRRAAGVHDDFAPIEKRYTKILELGRYAWEQLRKASPNIECLQESPPEAGLVAVRLKGHEPQRIVRYLETANCYARSMYEPECIRFSLHYFTTRAEVDRLVELLQNYEQRCQSVAFNEEIRNGNSSAYRTNA